MKVETSYNKKQARDPKSNPRDKARLTYFEACSSHPIRHTLAIKLDPSNSAGHSQAVHRLSMVAVQSRSHRSPKSFSSPYPKPHDTISFQAEVHRGCDLRATTTRLCNTCIPAQIVIAAVVRSRTQTGSVSSKSDPLQLNELCQKPRPARVDLASNTCFTDEHIEGWWLLGVIDVVVFLDVVWTSADDSEGLEILYRRRMDDFQSWSSFRRGHSRVACQSTKSLSFVRIRGSISSRRTSRLAEFYNAPLVTLTRTRVF